jgi:hypothetical protein
MRWLALAGAILFAYLTLFPAGLVISTIDSSCVAGSDCDQPLAQDLLLGVLYVACLVTVAASALAMALYFFRTTVANERRIRVALIATVAAVGATLFVQFAITFPLAALITFGIGGAVYGSLRYMNRDDDGPPDPSSNGHGKLNGHPG